MGKGKVPLQGFVRPLLDDLLRVVDDVGARAARRNADEAAGAAGRRSPLRVWEGGRRELHDQLADPTVSRANRDIVEDGFDPLGGFDNAEDFADEFLDDAGEWNWPPNNGAVPGSEVIRHPQPGETLDRIGGMTGDYFSPPGTPFGERALPPDRLNFDRRDWAIDAEHPDFSSGAVRMQESEIAPAFGQPGGGTQMRFIGPDGKPLSAQDLLDRGIISEVPRAG